jgi:hypothetical protein
MKKIIKTTVLSVACAAVSMIAVGCGDTVPDQGPDDPPSDPKDMDKDDGSPPDLKDDGKGGDDKGGDDKGGGDTPPDPK